MADHRIMADIILCITIIGCLVSLAVRAAVIPNTPAEVNTPTSTTAPPQKKITCLPVPVKYRHISQISPLDIHRLPRKKILGDNVMMPYPEAELNGVECTTDPDIQIKIPMMEDHWKTRIIIGCTMAAAVEVVIVILIVLYWKQIRWTLRKIPCPCDESRRQQRNASDDQGDENGNTNGNQHNIQDTDLSVSMAPSTSQGHHGQEYSVPRLHSLDPYTDQSENSDVDEVIEQVKMPSHCQSGTVHEQQSFIPKRAKRQRKSGHRAGSQESDDSEDILSTRPHRMTVSFEPPRVFDCSKSIGGKSFDSDEYQCHCHNNAGETDSHTTKVCKLCANSHSEIESETKSLMSNQSYRTGRLWTDGRHLDNPSLSNYVDFGSIDSASVKSNHSASSANPSVRSSLSKHTLDQPSGGEQGREGSVEHEDVRICIQNSTPVSSNKADGAYRSGALEINSDTQCNGGREVSTEKPDVPEPSSADVDCVDTEATPSCSLISEEQADRERQGKNSTGS